MTPSPTLVVGGGWSGLAAAVELCRRGRPVVLLEAAAGLGGRARAVRWRGLELDNGQHLLLGAYRETLALLDRLGVDPADAFERRPLELPLRAGDDALHLCTAPLPAPLHLALARGLSLSERLAALRLLLRLRQPLGEEDRDVRRWLIDAGQPPRLRRLLWEPLCLAALNTPAVAASAELFRRVLNHAFAPPAANADLLIARHSLHALLAEPARRFIEAHGGEVRTRTGVRRLRIEGGRLLGLETDRGPLAASRVILACDPRHARELLTPHPPLASLADAIGRLGSRPITTIYLHYPKEARLEPPLQGVLGEPEVWLFDRRLCGQPGLLAAVVSGDGPHDRLPDPELAARISGRLDGVVPGTPPLETLVVRERRATFDCRAGIDRVRPASATPVAGLWLAGDYTATGLPATLEGAVLSGRLAAESAFRRD